MKELAQKIKGYQEEIASLNSKCKMLAVKAKHATMLLTVSDIEGQQEMDEEKSKKSLIQAIMVRKHILTFCRMHCASTETNYCSSPEICPCVCSSVDISHSGMSDDCWWLSHSLVSCYGGVW